MIGAELGYFYVSPLIASEPGDPPPYDFIEYKPSTLPGVRLPHVWLEGGVAMQDRIGDGYTLLRLGGARHDASALQKAFAAIGAPFQVLDVPDPAARDIYARDLILLRPDMHVAWRGNAAPGQPATPRRDGDGARDITEFKRGNSWPRNSTSSTSSSPPTAFSPTKASSIHSATSACAIPSTRTATCSPAPARRSASSRPTSWSSRWRAIRSIRKKAKTTHAPYTERFIHGAIYEMRPEIMSVVHNHSPSTIPFGITNTKLKPLLHMCASIGHDVPLWDSHDKFGDTALLVNSMAMGRDLAKQLGKGRTALMRGHGAVVAGTSIRHAVFISNYLELNSKLQMQAMQMGKIKFLYPGEVDAVIARTSHYTLNRAWENWAHARGAQDAGVELAGSRAASTVRSPLARRGSG